MKHIAAPLSGFDTVPSIEAMLTELDPNYRGRPTRRYPIRYLRYWFIRYLLTELHRRLDRPIRVLEVGIGRGKMLAFMGGAQIEPGQYTLPTSIARWDALSAQADPETLRRYSYSDFRAVDLDKTFELEADSYDAVIVLHVLEHLAAPEAVMCQLASGVTQGGLILGGSPTMPDVLARTHERQLRRKYADKLHDVRAHKHLSVITPGRIRRFARQEGMAIDLLSGAFFLRASRSALEDRAWWLRANLAWGAAFPALGGEIYFALRKVRASLAALLLVVTGDLAVAVSS
jgi:2-polyprenyl-3-methyl-5-hydroxy-6-metoxy-1,4-benzoquinol methylase